MCRMSWKSGSLNLLEPSRPHRACYTTALPLPFTRWSRVVSLTTHFFTLGGLEKFSIFLEQRRILCLYRSPNSGISSPQLRHSHHSVLFLCYRNILHDSHRRSGYWLRSGRSAASDIHRLFDCRSNRVSCNPVVRLFNKAVSTTEALQSWMTFTYSPQARIWKQPSYFVINTIVFCRTHWGKPRNILNWDNIKGRL
jgi:hypothetical protein